MTELHMLAEEVGVNERTLRRAIADGLIHAERPTPHRHRLSVSEQRYVRRYWSLLGRLRRALRTEPNVRLAVVFGSMARGEQAVRSDVDVLVALADGAPGKVADLSRRLGGVVDRNVQLVRLGDTQRHPRLLAEVLAEGRVLIDRDGGWERLQRRRRMILRAAEDADASLETDALDRPLAGAR